MAPHSTQMTCFSFHVVTNCASAIYFGDILTWNILLYHECLGTSKWPFLWLFLLCILHLIQYPFINLALHPMNLNISTSPNHSVAVYYPRCSHRFDCCIKSILWISKFIKSLISIPCYPFIYYPFMHSMIAPHSDPKAHSDPKWTFIPLRAVGTGDDSHPLTFNKYRYSPFWKLFSLNGACALIRWFAMICIYDGTLSENMNESTRHYHYIWSLSLFFALCSILSALGILSKLISHNATTFVFRWCCFSGCFIGYTLCLRWLSHSNAEGLQFIMFSAVRFLLAKILIFSVPFAIWLGFRKMYLDYIYHRDINGPHPLPLQYVENIIQCFISCIF